MIEGLNWAIGQLQTDMETTGNRDCVVIFTVSDGKLCKFSANFGFDAQQNEEAVRKEASTKE